MTRTALTPDAREARAETTGSVAIVTRFVGPTDHRGSRIVASVPERRRWINARSYRVVLSYDHAWSSAQNHEDAAAVLAARLDWPGRLLGAATDNGYVWVFTPDALDADTVNDAVLGLAGVDIEADTYACSTCGVAAELHVASIAGHILTRSA